MTSAHTLPPTANSQKAMIALMTGAAIVSAGVVLVSPSKPTTPMIPIVTANQIRLAAAIDPSTILTAVEELIQDLASGDTYPLLAIVQEAQFAVNNVVLAADGALYGVTSSVGAVVENALGALLAPIGSTTAAHALYAAVDTLFENAVLPPSTLWNVGNFGLQPGTVLHNVLTIVQRVLGAPFGALQALITGLVGGSAASTAATTTAVVKSSVNSVAAVPKTGTKTTPLALNPISSTNTKVTKSNTPGKSDASGKSGKSDTSTPKTKRDKGSHGTGTGNHASASSGTHGHSGHGSSGGHGGH